MGTSGNPAKRAATKQAAVSSVSDFKKRKKSKPLELPSGLIVEARRVQLRSFISAGDVPNPLIPIVEEAINKGKNVDVEELIGTEEGSFNMELVNDMYQMVENVVVQSIVSPEVHPAPEDDEERDDDLLYVDEIEDEDKMFVFQWCMGGTENIAQFREEAEADMAALAEGQSPKQGTKRGSRAS